MLTDGQRTKCSRNITENYNRLSRVHERYGQTTDGRATAYSERERAFTFAKKLNLTQQKHTFTSQKKCTTTMHYNTK